MDKINNLSDAIRYGAALTKPGEKGQLCNRQLNGEPITETCALGAGLYAILGDKMTESVDMSGELEKRFPWLAGLDIRDSPSRRSVWHPWYEWVWFQYDHFGKTREQIAAELKAMGL